MTSETSLRARIVDPLVHRRVSAQVADRYVSADGGAPADAPGSIRERQVEERAMLERAFEHVRRGLGSSPLGKAAREQLRKIEVVMERDYGLYGRIRPDRD